MRLIALGFRRPGLTLGPLGIVDHSTDRGLMLWSDFTHATRRGTDLINIRPPSIRLFASRDKCWHYNQRIPARRRFTSARGFGSRSIKIRTAALDHELSRLLREINSRIDESSISGSAGR